MRSLQIGYTLPVSLFKGLIQKARVYANAENMPKVLGGLGVAVVSTSKGLLTDRKARKENLGGEVLAYIY